MQRLAGRMGMSTAARPMIVEGPAGTILAAVGHERDHGAAGRVLQKAQEARVRAGLPMPHGPWGVLSAHSAQYTNIETASASLDL